MENQQTNEPGKHKTAVFKTAEDKATLASSRSAHLPDDGPSTSTEQVMTWSYQRTKRRGNPRPSTSIPTLVSNISLTEERLSVALRQISQLPSFTPSVEAETGPSSGLTAGPERSIITAPLTTEKDQGERLFADKIFARHISLLKEYNGIKDVAMGMLSILAENQGRRLVELMEEYGLCEDD